MIRRRSLAIKKNNSLFRLKVIAVSIRDDIQAMSANHLCRQISPKILTSLLHSHSALPTLDNPEPFLSKGLQFFA
ncbi:MAG TPA: hypothetical protein VFA15_06590 [Nitrososphaera sp.]|nr:hypothetical protein [Nitrososphaera sp.]